MKNALFEGAGHRSRDVMPARSDPHTDGYTSANLTSFTLDPQGLTASHSRTLGTPFAPRLTLHQFHKQQLSPVPSSPPDLDYKRVRRKPSFVSAGQERPTSLSSPLIVTSSLPPAQLSSREPLLPSLLPPSPWTPTPPPAASSPSLSSTVDTLPSTPTQTPLQHSRPAFRARESSDWSGLSEPVRTKRKFSFKRAKRLPHPAVRQAGQDSGGGGIWQVHAAIIDFATGEDEFRPSQSSVGGGQSHVTHHQACTDAAPEIDQQQSSERNEKRERSVRFKEESTLIAPGRQTDDRALRSEYSLSNFRFPAPRGQYWTGTFGKHHRSSLTVNAADLYLQVISPNRHLRLVPPLYIIKGLLSIF